MMHVKNNLPALYLKSCIHLMKKNSTADSNFQFLFISFKNFFPIIWVAKFRLPHLQVFTVLKLHPEGETIALVMSYYMDHCVWQRCKFCQKLSMCNFEYFSTCSVCRKAYVNSALKQ